MFTRLSPPAGKPEAGQDETGTEADAMNGPPAHAGAARFFPSWPCGIGLGDQKVGAEFNQGMLKLRIPKAEYAQPRRIEVKVV